MPAREAHIKALQELLGFDYERAALLTDWEDKEYDDWKILHRFWKHDSIKTAKEAEELFGPGAGEAVRLHILMDNIETVGIFQNIGWVLGLMALGAGVVIAADHRSTTTD